MIDLHAAARALGGDVSGRNQINCPGPQHSARDRSLSVLFDDNAPDGFVVRSYTNDDPIVCRDHVRERLGMPEWRPGNGRKRRRNIRARPIQAPATRQRTDDDRRRIAGAARLWDEGVDPRGTAAEAYLKSRALELPSELAGTVLRFCWGCPWKNEDTGITQYLPALL